MDPVNPLGELIEEVRVSFQDRHGVSLSYADIARRGQGIGPKRVHQIATQPIKVLPPFDTLRALAKGLEVPYSVVLERALLSAGYELPRSIQSGQEGRKIG